MSLGSLSRRPGALQARTPRLAIALRPSRVLLVALTVLAALLAVPALLLLRDALQPERALYKDFAQEYLLARAVLDGVNPYIPMRDLAERYLAPQGFLDKSYPTPHPPSVGVLFMPLALIDYVSAVRIWFVIQVGCLIGGLALTFKAAGLPWLRPLPLVAFAMLSWVPVVFDLGMGQLTLPLLAALAASELALIRGRPRLGGALLGLALAVKPLTWLWLVPLVWRRAWSSVVAALAVVVASVGLAGMRVGFDSVYAYVSQVLPLLSATYASEMTNISWWTIGPRVFRGTVGASVAGIPPLVSAPQAAPIIGAAIPLLALMLVIAWQRTRPPLPAALGVMTCASILVNPLSWQYYLVLMLMPAAEVFRQLQRRGFPRLATLLAALLGIGLYLTGDDWRAMAQWLGSASASADQPIPPLAGLVTLGPSIVVAALGLQLAWLSGRPDVTDRSGPSG